MKRSNTFALLIFSLVPNIHFGQTPGFEKGENMASLTNIRSVSIENNYAGATGNHSTSAISENSVLDLIPPVFLDVPGDSMIVCRQMSSIPSIHAEDLSGPVTIAFSQMLDSDGPGTFVLTRKWVASDLSGNSSEAIQHITWIPESSLECDMILPESIEYDAHRIVMSSNVRGGFEPYSYLWKISGDRSDIDEGQGTPEIIINPGENEVNISLKVTDAFGCISICETKMVCPESVGKIRDSSRSNLTASVKSSDLLSHSGQCMKQLNLQHNPANGDLNFSFESTTDQPIKCKLVNFLGREVRGDQLACRKGYNTFKMDVRHFPAGKYVLQIISEKDLLAKSVVITNGD